MVAARTVEPEKLVHCAYSAYFPALSSEAATRRAIMPRADWHFRVHRRFRIGRKPMSPTCARRRLRQDGKVIYQPDGVLPVKPEAGLIAPGCQCPICYAPEDCWGRFHRRSAEHGWDMASRTDVWRPRPLNEMRSFRYPRSVRPSASPSITWYRLRAPLIGQTPCSMPRIPCLAPGRPDCCHRRCCRHGLNWTTPGLFTTSLDHAMWFQRLFQGRTEWFDLCAWTAAGPAAAGGNHGYIYRQDGTLIASVGSRKVCAADPGSLGRKACRLQMPLMARASRTSMLS